MTSMAPTSQMVNRSGPSMVSQGPYPVVSMEKATSIAKTVLKYTKLQLTLEQLVPQLQQRLPMIPMAGWATYCEQTYQMDKNKMVKHDHPQVQNTASTSLNQAQSATTVRYPAKEQHQFSHTPSSSSGQLQNRPFPRSTETYKIERAVAQNTPTTSLVASVQQPPSYVFLSTDAVQQAHRPPSMGGRNDGHPYRMGMGSSNAPLSRFEIADSQQTSAQHRPVRYASTNQIRNASAVPDHTQHNYSNVHWYRPAHVSYTIPHYSSHSANHMNPAGNAFTTTDHQHHRRNDMMNPSYGPRFAEPYARIMSSSHPPLVHSEIPPSVPSAMRYSRIAPSGINSREPHQGTSNNASRKVVSRRVSSKKHESILARAVLLAAGKVPNTRLNSRMEGYRSWLARDIRNTQFDVLDPPAPGQVVRQSEVVANKYIKAALQESQSSSQASINEQNSHMIDSTSKIVTLSSVVPTGEQAPATIKDSILSTATATALLPGQSVHSPLEVIDASTPSASATRVTAPDIKHTNVAHPCDKLKQTDDHVVKDRSVPSTAGNQSKSRAEARPEAQSKPSELIGPSKSLFLVQKPHMELPLEDVEAIDAEIHEIIPSSDSTIDGTPYTGPFDLNLNVSSAKNQDRARVHIPQTNSSKDEIKKSETAGSVLSEFTLDLRNTTRPADIYYDPDELSAIAAINDSREQRLRSLDPDLPGHLPGEVLSQDDSSIDADCGFPVYKCGFWQCSAELHDYDTLVKHCDKVHGHTDNSGMFVCHWGDCHIRKIFFSDIARWQTHLDEEHQQSIRYVCCVTNCKQAFPYEDDLALHMELLHPRPGNESPTKRGQSRDSSLPLAKRLKTAHNQMAEMILSDSDEEEEEGEEEELNANGDVEDDIDLLQHRSEPDPALRAGTEPSATVDRHDDYDTSMPGPQVTGDDRSLRNKLELHVGWNETWDIVAGLSIGVRGGEQAEVEVVMRSVPLRGREEPRAVGPVHGDDPLPDSLPDHAEHLAAVGDASVDTGTASGRESWYTVID